MSSLCNTGYKHQLYFTTEHTEPLSGKEWCNIVHVFHVQDHYKTLANSNPKTEQVFNFKIYCQE